MFLSVWDSILVLQIDCFPDLQDLLVVISIRCLHNLIEWKHLVQVISSHQWTGRVVDSQNSCNPNTKRFVLIILRCFQSESSSVSSHECAFLLLNVTPAASPPWRFLQDSASVILQLLPGGQTLSSCLLWLYYRRSLLAPAFSCTTAAHWALRDWSHHCEKDYYVMMQRQINHSDNAADV